MISNDLSTPLGLDRNNRQEAPRAPIAAIVLGATGVLAIGAIGWLIWKSDPYGGEPHAIVRIDRTIQSAMAKQPAEPAKTQAASDPARMRETASEVEEASGVKVTRGKGGSAPGALIIKVPDAAPEVARMAAIDRRLLERGRHGLLPKIAEGLRPREVYARPYDSDKAGGKPTIAILVTGLGIASGITGDAIGKLPSEISLAFAPYGTDLDKQAARARDNGHEVLLQLPMEPFDYPDNDPGPQTLLSDAPESNTIDRLHWLMGRFQGYVGLTNFMGAKFSASQKALKPVLDEAAKRGLMFVDDGSSPRSQIATVATTARLPAARGDVVLDGLDKPADIDAAFARAEAAARTRGSAIVVGPALPMTVERLARWVKSFEQKGIVLVPVSAMTQNRRG